MQTMIDSASAEERKQIRAEAEATLAALNVLMGQKYLSSEELHVGELAIEALTRLDATEFGKGWLYRAKRRVQLVQMYLGG